MPSISTILQVADAQAHVPHRVALFGIVVNLKFNVLTAGQTKRLQTSREETVQAHKGSGDMMPNDATFSTFVDLWPDQQILDREQS